MPQQTVTEEQEKDPEKGASTGADQERQQAEQEAARKAQEDARKAALKKAAAEADVDKALPGVSADITKNLKRKANPAPGNPNAAANPEEDPAGQEGPDGIAVAASNPAVGQLEQLYKEVGPEVLTREEQQGINDTKKALDAAIASKDQTKITEAEKAYAEVADGIVSRLFEEHPEVLGKFKRLINGLVNPDQDPQAEPAPVEEIRLEVANPANSATLKGLSEHPQSKQILEALGWPESQISQETADQLTRIMTSDKFKTEGGNPTLDALVKFAGSEIAPSLKAKGFNKETLLSNLIDQVSHPDKNLNLGDADLCAVTGEFMKLLKTNPAAYIEKVGDLFADGKIDVTVDGPNGKKVSVTIEIPLDALEYKNGVMRGGREARDMLEKAMLSAYTDAAVKLAFKQNEIRAGREYDEKKLPYYDASEDKVVYPPGTRHDRWGKPNKETIRESGLDREEDQAGAILVHGGAARLDLHQVMQNGEFQDFLLEHEGDVTPADLRDFASKIEDPKQKAQFEQFIEVLESGEPFGISVLYNSAELEQASLHKITMQYKEYEVWDEETQENITVGKIEFNNTWGESTDPEYDKHPWEGASKDGEHGNHYTSSLKDLLLNGNVDHVLDTTTEAGLATTAIEHDAYQDSSAWPGKYTDGLILNGQRITLPWMQEGKSSRKVNSKPKQDKEQSSEDKTETKATTDKIADGPDQDIKAARKVAIEAAAAAKIAKDLAEKAEANGLIEDLKNLQDKKEFVPQADRTKTEADTVISSLDVEAPRAVPGIRRGFPINRYANAA